jgi:hypothetical protein
MHFYAGGKKFTDKKGLFYAKFFELEEFSIEPFFCSSIQPQHTCIQQPAGSPNSPTKLVVWSFRCQSTVPLL